MSSLAGKQKAAGFDHFQSCFLRNQIQINGHHCLTATTNVMVTRPSSAVDHIGISYTYSNKLPRIKLKTNKIEKIVSKGAFGIKPGTHGNMKPLLLHH